MNQEETKTFLTHICEELHHADEYQRVLDPALIPYIVLGRAVHKLMPEASATVEGWINNNWPNEEEKLEFIRKYSSHSEPEPS